MVVEHHPNALKTRRDWLYSLLVNSIADQTVFLSADYRDVVAARLSPVFSLRRTCLMTNGVDIQRYAPDPKRPALPITIGMHSRFSPAKDHTTWLAAMAILRTRPGLPALRFELAGDGPTRTKMHSFAKQLGLAETVSFLGELDETQVVDTLRRWHIYAMSTHSETQSRALIEAGACGLAIAVSAVAGVIDAVDDSHDALLVPPQDPLALANALERLIRDPALRVRLGEAARQRAMTNHSLFACWQRYRTTLDEISSR
jgi:glycosyltransferase involved in cell wall biosynthesis